MSCVAAGTWVSAVRGDRWPRGHLGLSPGYFRRESGTHWPVRAGQEAARGTYLPEIALHTISRPGGAWPSRSPLPPPVFWRLGGAICPNKTEGGLWAGGALSCVASGTSVSAGDCPAQQSPGDIYPQEPPGRLPLAQACQNPSGDGLGLALNASWAKTPLGTAESHVPAATRRLAGSLCAKVSLGYRYPQEPKVSSRC